jgi:hypothetical protein
MVQIRNLHLRSLPLSAHYEYFTLLSRSLAAADITVRETLAPLLPEFHAWLEREDACLRWLRKSVLTEQIAAAARQVKHTLTGLNAAVQAARYLPGDASADAAERLRTVLKNYGRILQKPYDEMSGIIIALLESFDGKYADDIAALGLTVWITELRAAHNEYKRTFQLRNDTRAKKPPYTFRKDIRGNIERVYIRMAGLLNACSAMNAPGAIAFIRAFNPVINRFNAEFHRARRPVSKAFIAQIPLQPSTGAPITPVPDVRYTAPNGDVEQLSLGKDFYLTYKNNRNPGTASLYIHGKGLYKGKTMMTFNII